MRYNGDIMDHCLLNREECNEEIMSEEELPFSTHNPRSKRCGSEDALVMEHRKAHGKIVVYH
jgi:hypothetical protein